MKGLLNDALSIRRVWWCEATADKVVAGVKCVDDDSILRVPLWSECLAKEAFYLC